MTLSNASEKLISSFMAHDFHCMYHFPLPEAYMDSYFYAVTKYLSTKYVIKGWVKEPSKFR